jgi:radical SAM superfamily enzyme YgiQ (UPF0313 family)
MKRPKKQNFKIALVGVEFEENLSLRYLAGSLQAAGYSTIFIQPYNSILEAETIATKIINDDIDLVGVSMAFQVRAIDDMVLVQLLRKRGFKKHITAGGQFATLHYTEIFQDCTGLDSVVRFEAESVITELADALFHSTGLQHVSGLVWKDVQKEIHINHATPSPSDIDELPLPLRKNNRSEFLGLKNIQMIGSRGCHATCKYCCVSALATERRSASKDAGGLNAIPGTRRRTAISVANEIALLYFKHDVRIFEFQDDNWIHPKISVAVEYFTELKNELDKKGVGQIGLTLKTRADSVQPEIIKILKEIGLIRVFVGIESGTQNLLSQLGRKSRDNVSLQALQILRDFRVPAYFNALLFGPDIRSENIEPELEFLEKCTDFPFEIVEVVIYGKTGLYLSLKDENRLHGNYLDYEYDYLDEHTQRMHHIISNLETRHFGVYSPIKMAADLGFNLGLLQVFYPGIVTDSFAIKVEELNRKINEDQIRIIRKASEFASQKISIRKACDELLAETVSTDLQFYRSIIELHSEMEFHVSSITKNPDVKSYYRIGAIVQSGLVASLFVLSLNKLHAQTTYNPKLENDLVKLAYHYSWFGWQHAKKELKESKIPIRSYQNAIKYDTDSINRGSDYSTQQKTEKNLWKLDKKLEKLESKRVNADYKRLQHILNEHNPKIKIGTTLNFYLDNNGYVSDIQVSDTANGNTLSPELKKEILDLLKEKQFYAYETVRQIHKSKKPYRRGSYAHHKRVKKRMRRGPMD